MAGKNRNFTIAGWVFCCLAGAGVSTALHSQSSHFRFEHLSVAEGLSQNTPYCILQDRQGFMWFGTADGLNRYDGYEIVVYRHDPFDPHSISENTIRGLAEDEEGNLWIATDRGVNKWRREEDKFYRFLPDTSAVDFRNPSYPISSKTAAVYPDGNGIVWVGAMSGLYALRPATGKFRLYRPPELRDDVFFEVKKFIALPAGKHFPRVSPKQQTARAASGLELLFWIYTASIRKPGSSFPSRCR